VTDEPVRILDGPRDRMLGRAVARIHARSPRGSFPVTDLWWVGVSPWPSMPVAFTGEQESQTFRCCPDDGPTGVIVEVQVHLPRKPLDFAFTVVLDMDADDMEHLVDVHGFHQG